MILTRAEILLVDLKLRAPFTTSFGTVTDLKRPFVLLETSDGRRGLGEVPTLPAPAYKAEVDPPAVITSLKEFILPSVAAAQTNAEITSVEALQASYAWIKGAVFAKSGVEAAWWDLVAQEQNEPLWSIWGGTAREFTVGVSIGGDSIERVISLAQNAVDQGYKRLKVKIWPGFDEAPVRALRERFPDILLQADANSAYILANADALKVLDNYNLLLIEQPLFDDDIYYHSLLSQSFSTPLCLDESIHSLRDTEVAIALWQQHNALEKLVINIKPPRVSGFSEAIAIAQRCQAVGVKTWIGGMLDSGWGKAMNLQFNGLAAIDLPGDHFSPGGAYFVEDIISTPLVANNGFYQLGGASGAGVAIDWERFSRLAQSVHESRMAQPG